MLRAARGVMHELIQRAPDGSALLLCRLFHDRVMCVHQVFGRGPQEPVSYERGRLMPLFRGATSKVILAHLPARTLKSLYEQSGGEIDQANLGDSFEEFRAGACRDPARRRCNLARRDRSRPRRRRRAAVRPRPHHSRQPELRFVGGPRQRQVDRAAHAAADARRPRDRAGDERRARRAGQSRPPAGCEIGKMASKNSPRSFRGAAEAAGPRMPVQRDSPCFSEIPALRAFGAPRNDGSFAARRCSNERQEEHP